MKNVNTRQNKGITLIALIITVIVMLILAVVSIGSINGGLFDKVKQVADIYNNSVNVESEGIEQSINILDNFINGGKGTDQSGESDTVGGIGTENEPKSTDDDVLVADGSWNGTVDTPKLVDGMKAVYWAKDSSGDIDTVTPANNTYEINQDDPNFKAQDWYNYTAQTGTTDGKTSRWANAKTADGSYWVWIPRYEYKIDYTGVEQGINTDETKAGKIDVRFIDTNTKSGASGYTTDSAGITRSSDGYIIHPAFTNGTSDGFANGEWDSEIAGFWIAKFDISMQNGSGANVNTSSATIGNVALSSTVKAVSIPGVLAWNNINIANCYTNSYNYDRAEGSHLEKNSEWGAIAYLTHSQYGRNGGEVTINSDSSYTTGGGTGMAWLTSNTAQSSTGNTTGIYDIVGCVAESMASFNKAYSGKYFTNTSYLDVGKNQFASTGGSSTKYATSYNNSTSNEVATTLADFTSGGKDVSHVGDAIQEVWIKAGYSWFSEQSYWIYKDMPFSYYGRSILL
ncbi:MAG: hypothetical protein FWF46_06265 [Oscillospiraceae bacterium]|nr:hypothetical protein [Oscillospiraceae bacterium]